MLAERGGVIDEVNLGAAGCGEPEQLVSQHRVRGHDKGNSAAHHGSSHGNSIGVVEVGQAPITFAWARAGHQMPREICG
jgi:hypothetical protein